MSKLTNRESIFVADHNGMMAFATIRQLETQYNGKGHWAHREIVFETSNAVGTTRKLMVASRLKALDWEATTFLEKGLSATYQWFVQNEKGLRL